MDFDLGEQAAELRARLRALIAAHIAEDYLGAFTDDPADLDVAQRFCKTLADEGLLTIAWPTEYGGGGGSVWDQTVVREEMWAHHEPRGAQYMGLNWVGPAIMAFGTDAQKQQHLSAIAAGDVIWCQGFSEPEAGSDLASLSTRATEDGDGWRITGQKIWTSYAGMAQWCVLAARVGPGERHEGITMFLVPMDTPGITVRPIRSMLGHHHLNEVFFDDVCGRPRRRARRDRRGLGRDPQGARPRAGRHRPLRPLRAPPVARSARELAPALGRACPPSLHAAVGPRARAGAGGPAARLPHRARPGDRRAPRRARLARPASPSPSATSPVAEVLFQALEEGSARGRARARRSTAPSRTTGATRRPPRWRRAPSRCSA